MHDYIAYWISKEVERHKIPDLFRVVEAHYFQGRFTLEKAIQEGKVQGKEYPSKIAALPPEAYYIAKDRQIDEILMYSNITTHYYPMAYDIEQERGKEKGIDVWLSLEASDLAVHKRFDYFVLFSGDEDFVPLVRKINSLGITTIIPKVDIAEPIATKTSQKLIQEASYHFPIDKKLANKDSLDKEESEKITEVIYDSSKQQKSG